MKALVTFSIEKKLRFFIPLIFERREFFINPLVSLPSILRYKIRGRRICLASPISPDVWAVGKGPRKWIRKVMVLGINKICILVVLLVS